jgi:endonuclease YncB( thermonuclease family)
MERTPEMPKLQRRCLRPLLMISVLAIATTVVVAATPTGKGVGIADGDTLTLLAGKTQIKVRLEDIDTPERGRPFGRKTGQSLAKKVFGKVAQVDDLGKGRGTGGRWGTSGWRRETSTWS